MQVCTTFFNNEQFYEQDFIKWYTNIWGATEFIFFIGRSQLKTLNFTYNNINFNYSEINNIKRYEYVSGTNTPSDWHNLKQVFYNILENRHKAYPSLWVDCDELIYSKNIDSLISKQEFQTHFYEYVPATPFNLFANSIWCECPWYYREQALNNHFNNHSNCKKFSLLTPRAGGHMGYNTYCNNSFTYEEYDNICFHIGVYSQNHYLENKHWQQTHPDGIEIPHVNRDRQFLNNHFERFHLNCIFNTFELNIGSYLK